MEYYSLTPPLHFITFSLLILSASVAASLPHRIQRLGIVHKRFSRDPFNTILASDNSGDFKTFFYTQTLDHFNYRPESYATFQQRYVINSEYWGGANESAPIFVYLGAEAALDGDVYSIGFLPENAPHFKALLVYIEHRFYGQSNPCGSMEETMKNESTRGYFNSAQAIADYAEVITYLKEKNSAQNSPVIVIGGSYGGMLASWFRLKYPHVALGALASSAPILYFDDITPQNGYYSVVTKSFKDVSKSCYETIRESWSEIDRVASKPSGLSILGQRFKICERLNKSSDLKDYLDSTYSAAAQYNSPHSYPVTKFCSGVDGAKEGTDILGRIFAGVVASKGNRSCYDLKDEINPTDETSIGWSWQTCSEMVMPIGRGSNDTMFPAQPFILKEFIQKCISSYGVPPRPHWITTNYGGHDIKLVLRRFASNIIFSNGLRDPYSSAGVLENLSDSLLAVHTSKGSHCLDIVSSQPSDPQWLINQRKVEVKIIERWLKQYYSDLVALSYIVE